MAGLNYIKGRNFVIPGVVILLLTTLGPLVTVFYYSFFRIFLYSFNKRDFVWFRNFIDFLTDPVFYNSARVTLIYTVSVTFFSVLCGLLIALMLNRKEIKGKSVFITVFLLPFIVTPVVIGIIWSLFVWQPDYGLVNYILDFFNIDGPAWLNSRETAMFSIVLTNVWKLAPLALLPIYAALTTVPQELIEQSKIDGARPLSVFKNIIFPFIKGQVVFISLVIMTSAYREFDTVISLTGGGPGRTTSVFSLLVYRQSILSKNIGSGSAIAVLMFIIIAFISWGYIKLTNSKDSV